MSQTLLILDRIESSLKILETQNNSELFRIILIIRQLLYQLSYQELNGEQGQMLKSHSGLWILNSEFPVCNVCLK